MDYDKLLMAVIIYDCSMIHTILSWGKRWLLFSVFPLARVLRGKIFCAWVSGEGTL